jgi:alcohol dehydrogenase (cytochrome c)
LKRNICLAAVLAAVLLSGCSGSSAAVTTELSPTISQPTASPGTTTAGMLAQAGTGAYRVYCSGCHGPNGVDGAGGVVLVGSGSALSLYGNFNGLLSFISQRMPYENRGSLTELQYYQITAYLAVNNGFISPSANRDNLADIILL